MVRKAQDYAALDQKILAYIDHGQDTASALTAALRLDARQLINRPGSENRIIGRRLQILREKGLIACERRGVKVVWSRTPSLLVPGSTRGHWATGIGWIIYSLNEIDLLLTDVHKTLTVDVLTNKWRTLVTAKRLERVEMCVKGLQESPATIRFLRLASRTRSLLDKRNHIAHGFLAVESGDQLVMLRYNKKSERMDTMSYQQLRNAERAARQLSDDFSLFLALCKMHTRFLAPYGPNEPRGAEIIKPRDPAPGP